MRFSTLFDLLSVGALCGALYDHGLMEIAIYWQAVAIYQRIKENEQ